MVPLGGAPPYSEPEGTASGACPRVPDRAFGGALRTPDKASGARPAGTGSFPQAPSGRAEASMRWAMSLALTEEHLALADSVRGWAGHTAPPTTIRSVVDAED